MTDPKKTATVVLTPEERDGVEWLKRLPTSGRAVRALLARLGVDVGGGK